MENLKLRAIFTGSKFLRACMLMILMDSQTCTGKRQTMISRAWIAFRPPECDSARPMEVGKRAGGDREGAVQLRSLWLTQPQSLMIPGVNPSG